MLIHCPQKYDLNGIVIASNQSPCSRIQRLTSCPVRLVTCSSASTNHIQSNLAAGIARLRAESKLGTCGCGRIRSTSGLAELACAVGAFGIDQDDLADVRPQMFDAGNYVPLFVVCENDAGDHQTIPLCRWR